MGSAEFVIHCKCVWHKFKNKLNILNASRPKEVCMFKCRVRDKLFSVAICYTNLTLFASNCYAKLKFAGHLLYNLFLMAYPVHRKTTRSSSSGSHDVNDGRAAPTLSWNENSREKGHTTTAGQPTQWLARFM